MAGAWMTDVPLQCPFQYAKQLRDVRILEVERARTRQQQEQRFRI
jgi:hypothetical protein